MENVLNFAALHETGLRESGLAGFECCRFCGEFLALHLKGKLLENVVDKRAGY